MESEIYSLISSLGFPIFVSLWFMLRTEKVIAGNTQALIELREEIKKK